MSFMCIKTYQLYGLRALEELQLQAHPLLPMRYFGLNDQVFVVEEVVDFDCNIVAVEDFGCNVVEVVEDFGYNMVEAGLDYNIPQVEEGIHQDQQDAVGS